MIHVEILFVNWMKITQDALQIVVLVIVMEFAIDENNLGIAMIV
jgi:hypothetical protein